MAGEINLLPQREYEVQRKELIQRWFYLASVFLLVLELLAVVGVFGFLGVRSLEIRRLTSEINKTTKTIQDLSAVEGLQATLEKKAAKILSITDKQRRLDKVLEKVAEVMPNGVKLSGINLSDKNDLVTSGEARNSTDLSTFLINLIDEEKGGKYFSEVNVGSLASSSEGKYSFGLNMKIKEEVVK